jgi:uncharacterized membrane protein YbaN (DUF454 family)
VLGFGSTFARRLKNFEKLLLDHPWLASILEVLARHATE